ncbi:MAG: hypothetical protein V8T08_05130 [Monoglobus pectinilyticus]
MAKIYIDPGHNASGADTGAVGYGLKNKTYLYKLEYYLEIC